MKHPSELQDVDCFFLQINDIYINMYITYSINTYIVIYFKIKEIAQWCLFQKFPPNTPNLPRRPNRQGTNDRICLWCRLQNTSHSSEGGDRGWESFQFDIRINHFIKSSLVAWLRIPGMLIQHNIFCFIWKKNKCEFNTNNNYNNYCNIQWFVLTYFIGRPLILKIIIHRLTV